MAYEQSKARRQKAAVEAIEKIGGRISYDPKVSQRPNWLKSILGDDSFKANDDVRLDGTKVTDMDLDNLLGMPNLRILCLNETGISDEGLRKIGSLSSLERLLVADTPHISDAGLVHVGKLRIDSTPASVISAPSR